MNPSSPSRRPRTAAHAASEVVELLEVLWERGRAAAPPAPVPSAQLRVLYVLERAEGINLRALGQALGAAPSSVSRLCDRLEAAGYVARRHSPLSGREVDLRLTGAGRAYLAELRARREDVLLTAIAAMAPEERAALVGGLSGFRQASEGLLPRPRRTVGPRPRRTVGSAISTQEHHPKRQGGDQ
ncbi:MarR family transcriptional regulator [Streptomyces sp. MST-110588]|uniref:MarR family winged helix-turn-helix transcriptional regulator n=1 Tax=Streptomyces sp. MST-110588 TaxID=2833628 RepID=UPI001F5C4BDA|nr:MarR family transcriptional regulator [Streptomyces sp. MST-110588]UNO41083.1 MarR family transcriptional regulator [Streptomyces sp. MST-110588]